MARSKKPPSSNKTLTVGEVRIIAGKHRGRKLVVHHKDGLRPTGNRTRETLFNWLQGDIHGARCADLFTGSGALAFEAASRGAAHVDAIDLDSDNISALNQSKIDLNEAAIQLYCADALSWLQQQQSKLDIVFIDPPFATDLLTQCLELLGDHPSLHRDSCLYLEADKSTHIGIPNGWQWHRHKVSGDVQFGLLRQA